MYDCIIVLSNLMESDGVLNKESKQRLEEAAKAYHENLAPLLLTSGWDCNKQTTESLAYIMRRDAISQYDIPEDKILYDENSRDTIGDAYFTKQNYALPLKWKNVLLVSGSTHIYRAHKIFDFIYGPSFQIDSRAPKRIERDKLPMREITSLEMFTKTFDGIDPGDDILITERIKCNHPYYNGDTYSKI